MFNSPFVSVRWQQGDPREGVNGATVSDVLAVCLDRLKVQVGDKKTNSREAALARNKVEEAVMWLKLKEGNDGLADTNFH